LETRRFLPSDPWKRAADRLPGRLETRKIIFSMARESVRAAFCSHKVFVGSEGDSLRNGHVGGIEEWLGRNVLFFIALTDKPEICVAKQHSKKTCL